MTGIDSYSTTPATNATADGGSVNWAEGQPPSSVNNTARQWMADTRARHNDLMWFQYGTGDQGAGNLAVPSVYASASSFTITGVDVTTVYHAFRRVRAVGSGTGTIFGTITSSSYNGGNSKTTVNVAWDAGGSLTNETLTISLSQSPLTGAPVAGVPVLLTTLTASTSASLSYTGFSSAYRSYRFEFDGIAPASDNVDFYSQLSVDRGANWLSGSDYVYGAHYWNTSSSTAGADFNVAGTTVWNLSPTNGNGISNASWFSGSMGLQNMNSASVPQTARYDFIYQRSPADNYFGGNGNAIYAATVKTVKNGIKFYMSSGNIASGSILVYGIP